MAEGFTGDPVEFTKADKNITQARAEMDQRLTRLRGEIEATRAGWDSDASRVFTKVMDRFDTAGRRLNAALQGIGHLLSEAGSTYQASDQERKDFIQAKTAGISNVLDG